MKLTLLFVLSWVLLGCSDSDDDDDIILPRPPAEGEPEIVSILPVNIASGQNNRVSIYGENLDELPGLAIAIGGERVTDIQVAGEKEIMLVTPKLEEGIQNVQISSLLGFENSEYSLVSHGETILPENMFTIDATPSHGNVIQNRVIFDFARSRIYYKTEAGVGVLSNVSGEWNSQEVVVASNDMILSTDNLELLLTEELESRTNLIRLNLDSLVYTTTPRSSRGQRIMQFYDGEILIPSDDDLNMLGLDGNSIWRYTRTRNRLIGGGTFEEYLYVHTTNSSTFYSDFYVDASWDIRWNMSESSHHHRTSRHAVIRGEGVTDDLNFNDENMTEISPNAELVFRVELRDRVARVLDIREDSYGQQIGEEIDLSSLDFSDILEVKITDDNKYAILYGAGPRNEVNVVTAHFIQAIKLPEYN